MQAPARFLGQPRHEVPLPGSTASETAKEVGKHVGEARGVKGRGHEEASFMISAVAERTAEHVWVLYPVGAWRHGVFVDILRLFLRGDTPTLFDPCPVVRPRGGHGGGSC